MAKVEPLKHSAQTHTVLQLTPEECAVIRAIRDIRFGSVEVVIHQAKIAQLVRSERVRFDSV